MIIFLWIIGICAVLFGVVYVGVEMNMPSGVSHSIWVQILLWPFIGIFTVLFYVLGWIIGGIYWIKKLFRK